MLLSSIEIVSARVQAEHGPCGQQGGAAEIDVAVGRGEAVKVGAADRGQDWRRAALGQYAQAGRCAAGVGGGFSAGPALFPKATAASPRPRSRSL